jgi:hypothetical protein
VRRRRRRRRRRKKEEEEEEDDSGRKWEVRKRMKKGPIEGSLGGKE